MGSFRQNVRAVQLQSLLRLAPRGGVSRVRSIHGQHGAEGQRRQRPQGRLLLGERLRDDALRGPVQALVGHRSEPAGELRVQILEVAEGTRQEEVLAHVRNGRSTMPLSGMMASVP